jgi:hypothetical protein
VRLAPYIFPELIDTVSSAWAASPIARVARRVTWRWSAAGSMFMWGTVAFAITAWLALAPSDWKTRDTTYGLLGGALSVFGLYLTYRRMRYRWLVLRHTTRGRRIAICAIYSPLDYVLGLLYPLLFMMSSELLLFMALWVMPVIALNFVAYPFARMFTALGSLAAACRMNWLRRWIHRLGWVMIVLPVHTLLQATKASGNLISIVLYDKRIIVKVIATLWLVEVYFQFLIVLLFSEVLILFPVMPLFRSIRDGPTALALTEVFFYFFAYLLLLRSLLSTLDLLLDISNYHIASTRDRSSYQQRVERAVQSLRDSGCIEVHIVAHSLGSVITYDWLSSARSTELPRIVLHTLGSPLNKFWYLDHPRRRRLADAIHCATFPACRWTNYWAFSDVISGPCKHYHVTRPKIRDERIRWFGPVFVSHLYYWTNAIVLAGIRDGISKSDGSSP